MIDVSGHLRTIKNKSGFVDTENPITVNCCGYQSCITKDYSVEREHGRRDYQIIYVFRGCGHFKIENEWKRFPAGSLVLYRPYEPQIYTYLANDTPELFWVHFTGHSCENLLEKFGIKTGYIGENFALKSLFHETMLELQLKKPLFEYMITSNFYKIFATIQRAYLLQSVPLENNFSIDRLIIHLNRHYADSWTVADMADFCNMSEDYFAHIFKKRMGVSPMRFLNNLRIDRAKDFLLTDTMNIATIASLVGFDDQLYFSRVFKKFTGYSPKAYYQYILNLNTPF